jgi:predicted dehydrogenase
MSHGKLIRDFYENLIKGANKDIIPVEEAMISLQLIEGIYKSSSTGNKIKIN